MSCPHPPRRGHMRLLAPFAIALLMLVSSGDIHAGEAHFYLQAYGFQSTLSGDGRVSDGSAGTDFDLENTLGIDSEEVLKGIDGFVKFGGSRIEFSYGHVDYSGHNTLSGDLEFNGTTFSAGQKIDSDIDMNRYRLLYGYSFGLKVVDVGFVVGGLGIDIDATVSSSAAGRERQSFQNPIPVVGGTIGIHPISQIAIHGELTGMSASIANIRGKALDGYADVEYLFLAGKFGITAGYRYFLLDATDSDKNNHIDIKQHGPYVGLALHI